MSRRYDDRDYDRDSQYGQYNQRQSSNYGRGLSPRSEYGRDWESERYGNEGRFPGDEDTSRYSSGSRRSGAERGYSEGLNQGYSQRYNYPTGFRSNERSGERRRENDYDRNRYDRSSYNREEERGEERGWLDRASDAISSWFGDEDAERRRRMDAQREHRGRGPKGYRRSDERIREDVNDRLSDDYYLDASEVEVNVSNTEVTLTGTVNSRTEKRRAEDLADSVSGVTNVENRLRVKQSGYGDYNRTTNTGTSSNTVTPTTSSSAAAGGGTSKS